MHLVSILVMASTLATTTAVLPDDFCSAFAEKGDTLVDGLFEYKCYAYDRKGKGHDAVEMDYRVSGCFTPTRKLYFDENTTMRDGDCIYSCYEGDLSEDWCEDGIAGGYTGLPYRQLDERDAIIVQRHPSLAVKEGIKAIMKILQDWNKQG